MTDLTAHEARREYLRSMEALRLEVPAVVADDVQVKTQAYADAREAASRALVEQMREALREEVKKRHHYTDGSQPDDAWLDAKIAEMYPALAAVPDPEEPEKVVGGPGDDEPAWKKAYARQQQWMRIAKEERRQRVAFRKALHRIAYSAGGQFELIDTLREIARDALDGEPKEPRYGDSEDKSPQLWAPEPKTPANKAPWYDDPAGKPPYLGPIP